MQIGTYLTEQRLPSTGYAPVQIGTYLTEHKFLSGAAVHPIYALNTFLTLSLIQYTNYNSYNT